MTFDLDIWLAGHLVIFEGQGNGS